MEYFRKGWYENDMQIMECLNPCCNGILSKDDYFYGSQIVQACLNPCCNGILSKETYLLLFSILLSFLMYKFASVNHL